MEELSELKHLLKDPSVGQLVKDKLEKAIFCLEKKEKTMDREILANRQLLEESLQELQNKTSKMMSADKMVSLGQLVAGISHEINNPVGAIRASSQILMDQLTNVKNSTGYLLFLQLDDHLKELFFSLLEDLYVNARSRHSRELRLARKAITKQLLDAGVEHAEDAAQVLVDVGLEKIDEVYLELFKIEDLDLLLETLKAKGLQRINCENIRIASERVVKIVSALKSYSHQTDTEQKREVDLESSLETVLTIYNHRLRDVSVVRDYQSKVLVSAYEDKLFQVWTNLIHNALDAMNQKGELVLTIKNDEEKAFVGVSDSGTGMSKELIKEIFDPFFTTKDNDKGTGLGLAIVKDIVNDDHNGEITIESTEGLGTTFWVELPLG